MDTVENAFALAVDHHQNGRSEAAARIYRLIIEVAPAHPAALNNLGLIAAADEAVTLFRRAVSAAPNYVDALVNLSSALQARGEMADAAVALGRAVSLIADHPASLFRLAHVLHTQGRAEEAALHYERVIQLQPDHGAALCNLGTIHNGAERTSDAFTCYSRALAIDPGLEVANLNMVSILEADGRLEEAKRCRARLPHPHPLEVEHAPDHRRTVLVLANACVGNVPLDTILSKRTNTRVRWHADFATDEQASALPPFDVALNAIGNADVFDEAFSCVSHFAKRHRVLNHPEAVARTRRDRLPGLLDGILNLVVPQTLRLPRAQASGPALAASLAAAGMACPVLIRPIAGHGGEGAQLVETTEQLAAYQPGKADFFYVIAYHDVRQPDGHYRKYRTIYVDRKPYAYHLAISDHWLVHYFSASMMAAPWKREEERRFLENPASALGEQAMTALDELGHRLDLEFAGIDYALLPDGQVLLFEANATMLVHLRDSATDFPYKHAHVPAIFDAFEAMLDRYAGAAASPSEGVACPPPLP